jgi:hypothetical protein
MLSLLEAVCVVSVNQSIAVHSGALTSYHLWLSSYRFEDRFVLGNLNQTVAEYDSNAFVSDQKGLQDFIFEDGGVIIRLGVEDVLLFHF